MIFERIYDQTPFCVDLVDPVRDPGAAAVDVVISFSSIGHDARRMPSPEFVGTATHGKRRALFVMDGARSWANDPGFGAMVQQSMATVQSRGPIGRVVAIGLSMGAFSALACTRFIPVDAVLAFGPQWSISTDHMPHETRWAEWRSAVHGPMHWPTAPMPDPNQTWACLFHGLRDDGEQAMAFPQQKGIDHLLFPDLGHSDLLPHLKSQGVLNGLMDAAIARDRRRLLRIVAATGGKRRDKIQDLSR